MIVLTNKDKLYIRVLTGLDLTKQVKLLFINISKTAKSKQNKQEVSCTVLLPLKVALFGKVN